VLIPPGTYVRGASSRDTEADECERPSHKVEISKAFYLGVYEVTQGEWSKLIDGNPSHFKGERLPVEMVSWDNIQLYLQKSDGLRLPTEGEWEYACRAGTTGSRYGQLDDVAWYGGNTKIDTQTVGGTRAVGEKNANAFGLYDMLGNAMEWCSDWYGGYSNTPQVDPQGPNSGDKRIIRGGAWSKNAVFCRASSRNYVSAPDGKLWHIGFRVARTP